LVSIQRCTRQCCRCGTYPGKAVLRYACLTSYLQPCVAKLFGTLTVLSLCLLIFEFPSARAATEAVADKAPRFDVTEFRVSGNSLLNTLDIELTLYRFLGHDKVFADIEQARQALEQRYRDKGYPAVVVDIPEQSVNGGSVWLRVTESRISHLRITGTHYYSPRDLAIQLGSVQAGNRLQLPAIQKDLNAASAAYPERKLVPVLRPGATPGTVDMEIKVRDQLPLHGSLEVNDRFGENTSRWRSSVSLGNSNLWQKGHALTMQYQTAPEKPDEVKVWSGTYLIRQLSSPAIYALYAVDSRSNTSALGDISVIGDGRIYGLRWINPDSHPDGTSRSISLGADYKDFGESLVIQGADSQSTPVSYLSFSVAYSRSHIEAESNNKFDVSTVFGVRGLTNSVDEFASKRWLAQPNFIYLRAGFEISRTLFLGSRVRLAIDGQVADSPLISNEQYTAGGSDTVRGYHESQLLGDDGARLSVEWHTPSLLGSWKTAQRDAYGLLFWDAASLHTQEPLPDQARHTQLASAGAGLRFYQASNWDVRVDWARVYKTAGTVLDGSNRYHVLFNYSF